MNVQMFILTRLSLSAATLKLSSNFQPRNFNNNYFSESGFDLFSLLEA